MTVAITAQGMAASPIFVADKQGFFAQNGLSVERSVVSAGGAAVATAVISNSVSLAYANASPILSPSTAKDVLLLATPSVHYPYSLLVAPAIKTVKDLDGKTIGVSAYNGQDDLALTALLEASSVNPSSVKRLAIGGGMPARLAALTAGKVDGSLFGPPYDITVKRQNFTLLSKVYEDVKGPVAQDVVYTSKSYAQAHHAETVGFLKALIQAIRFGKANPEPTKQLIKQWVTVEDDEQLQASYDAYFTHEFESDPTPQPAAIQTNIDNEAKARGEKSSLQPDQVIDASFVKEALAALPR